MAPRGSYLIPHIDGIKTNQKQIKITILFFLWMDMMKIQH